MKKLKFFLLVLVILLVPKTLNAKTVNVTLPKFVVNINGVEMKYEKSRYPLIVYRDITYFPLTYKNSRFLGLTTDWDNDSRIFSVSRDPYAHGEYDAYLQKAKNNSSYKASVPSFTVNVNGNRISNSKEKYPLLVFRDVTYFPLTWRFCHDEFSLYYSYTNRDGLMISSDAKEIVAPKDTSKSEDVSSKRPHLGSLPSRGIDEEAFKYSEYNKILYSNKFLNNDNAYLVGKNEESLELVISALKNEKPIHLKEIKNGRFEVFDNGKIYFESGDDSKKTINYYDIDRDEVKTVVSVNASKWDPLLFTVLNDKIYYKTSLDNGALKDITGRSLSNGGLTGLKIKEGYVVATFDNKEVLVFDRDQNVIYRKKANVDIKDVKISGNKISFLDVDSGKRVRDILSN